MGTSITSTTKEKKAETLLSELVDFIKSNRGSDADVLERIQQQLGQINNGNNLEQGERFV